MMGYAFTTTWRLAAPLDRVTDVLADVERWPEWFRAVRRVTIVDPGGPDGVGGTLDVTVRGVLPYDLTIRLRATRVEAPHLLELTALGDLDGWGRWMLTEDADGTTARFDWRVTTSKLWMNALAPVARPLFAWNHDVVMTAAGRGLARRLGVPLLENRSGIPRRAR